MSRTNGNDLGEGAAMTLGEGAAMTLGEQVALALDEKAARFYKRRRE